MGDTEEGSVLRVDADGGHTVVGLWDVLILCLQLVQDCFESRLVDVVVSGEEFAEELVETVVGTGIRRPSSRYRLTELHC